MSKTKKLFIFALVLILGVGCVIPSAFSWYDHNGNTKTNIMLYSPTAVPVSGSTGFSMSTVMVDKNGAVESNTNQTKVTFSDATKTIQYYKTTFDNSSGTGDVYANLSLKNLKNDANIRVGITDPVINDRGFAISRTPTTNNSRRVYFIPTSAYSKFWWNVDTSSNEFDMKICYPVDGTETIYPMTVIPLNGSKAAYKDGKTGDNATYVCYIDIPKNVPYFFFCNHWYDPNDANKNWNRTPDITDNTAGVVYRLTGKNIQDSYKLYDKQSFSGTEVNTDLVALNRYYSTVRLNVNGYTDISLKKETDGEAENFTPDYYGKTITYSSGNSNLVHVNTDGLITGRGVTSGTNITTTIRGDLNDTITCTTKVIITTSIAEMPVAQNVPVKKGEKVEIYWYVTNKGAENGNGEQGDLCDLIYYTV